MDKKVITLITFSLMILILFGCTSYQSNQNNSTNSDNNSSITVVATPNLSNPVPAPVTQPTVIPVSYCGNGICNNGENAVACPQDCKDDFSSSLESSNLEKYSSSDYEFEILYPKNWQNKKLATTGVLVNYVFEDANGQAASLTVSAYDVTGTSSVLESTKQRYNSPSTVESVRKEQGYSSLNVVSVEDGFVGTYPAVKVLIESTFPSGNKYRIEYLYVYVEKFTASGSKVDALFLITLQTRDYLYNNNNAVGIKRIIDSFKII